MKNLSGGNAQKVVLARESARNPSVLVAAQPTRGVDRGATEYLRGQIVEQRAKGTAPPHSSEDLDEMLALSDPSATIFHGEIMGVLERSEATAKCVGLMTMGEAA